MSPIAAVVVTISPPPPRPCSARKAISDGMFRASPHSAEPTRKRTIAVCKTSLPPVEVTELPVQRRHDRRRQQVRRDHPREMLDAAKIANDRRQRRRDDRLIERREQRDEKQRRENQTHTLLPLEHNRPATTSDRDRRAHTRPIIRFNWLPVALPCDPERRRLEGSGRTV